MRAAFSALELIIAIALLGILAGFGLSKSSPSLHHAALSTLSHIKYAQHLALNDSLVFDTLRQTRYLTAMHPSIDPQKLLESHKNFWQIQFHQTGIYTLNSYSIFFDTPRFSPTTDRDNQPQPGDIIARNGANMRCLSGYSNVNISIECRNNAEVSVRLHERFGVESIRIEGEPLCQEMGTFRIAFDALGAPYCTKSKSAHKLIAPLKIILQKGAHQKAICVMPQSGYSFLSKDGRC
ncbi:hypothetical protein BKN38_00945 [Helicobacter sp. CLO-3]|uniref:pilus assembly FimT family protein n=1 Tax=unclassified Helicobacter TaxID=2593540 RepID=UPI0008048153|nr:MULTISPECIES: prepilin-type N-terminal cleavage/methylation domain-containing protein [unclassified Helicobacter]OBV29154.1 hypothetical protein BA723_06540 [Helicobacter sp. CLO-3]OHU85618.1 hypothetical protein BKN38_00945 [Helicobacter sp. CLO-3]